MSDYWSADELLHALIQKEVQDKTDESGALQSPLANLYGTGQQFTPAGVRAVLGEDFLRGLYTKFNPSGVKVAGQPAAQTYDQLVNQGTYAVPKDQEEGYNTFDSFGDFASGAFNREDGGGWGYPILAAVGAAAGAAASGAGSGASGAGAGEVGASYGSYGVGGYTTQAAGAYGGAGSAGVGAGESVSGSYGSGSEGSSNGYFDDYSGQWVDGGASASDPYGLGVDQYGNPTGQYADSTFQGGQPDLTNYGQNSQSLMQQAQDLSKQLGISPSSAITLLKNALGGGAAGVANGAGGGLGGILGNLLGAGFGAYASNQQANSLNDLANKYMSFGAPSRARYEASYAPGFTMANDPGYTDALNASSKATLHGLSVQGNPAGSPNAWNQSLSDINSKFAYPALQRYREQNANTGGIGTLTAAAPAAASGAIAQQGNVYNAIGGGLSDIFNPPKSLAQQWAEMMGK